MVKRPPDWYKWNKKGRDFQHLDTARPVDPFTPPCHETDGCQARYGVQDSIDDVAEMKVEYHIRREEGSGNSRREVYQRAENYEHADIGGEQATGYFHHAFMAPLLSRRAQWFVHL